MLRSSDIKSKIFKQAGFQGLVPHSNTLEETISKILG